MSLFIFKKSYSLSNTDGGGKDRARGGGGGIECLKAQIHDSCQYQGPERTLGLWTLPQNHDFIRLIRQNLRIII